MSIVQQFVVTRPSNNKYKYVTLQLLGDECNLKNGKKKWHCAYFNLPPPYWPNNDKLKLG